LLSFTTKTVIYQVNISSVFIINIISLHAKAQTNT
jgi:hypothetical protein